MGQECRAIVDDPSVETVLRARRAQVRMAAPILDSAKEERGAVLEPRSRRIEDRVRWIGPLRCGENWVARVPAKECLVAHSRHWMTPRDSPVPFDSTGFRDKRVSRLTLSADRMSKSESKKDSVDSPPWFSFTRSECKPSRHPPVDGS